MGQKIICGDSLEIMRGFADKQFDLVLTDPPYGVTSLIWDNDETPQEAKQKASETLIRQWVLRQTLEWSMAVDLDAKLANTGIFLRKDNKAYHIRNFDHDELLGVNSTGRLTQEQFRKFFYYFWFVQANELRALDAKNNTQLEAVFHDAVKQSGIFKTLYENQANVDLLRDAFHESFVRFQARAQAMEKRKQDLKTIRTEFEQKNQALKGLRAEAKKPGAPPLGAQIDAAEEELRRIKAGYDTRAAQKEEASARHAMWLSYLDSLMAVSKSEKSLRPPKTPGTRPRKRRVLTKLINHGPLPGWMTPFWKSGRGGLFLRLCIVWSRQRTGKITASGTSSERWMRKSAIWKPC